MSLTKDVFQVPYVLWDSLAMTRRWKYGEQLETTQARAKHGGGHYGLGVVGAWGHLGGGAAAFRPFPTKLTSQTLDSRWHLLGQPGWEPAVNRGRSNTPGTLEGCDNSSWGARVCGRTQ